LLAVLNSQQPTPTLLQGIGVAAYGLPPSLGVSAYGGPGIGPGLGGDDPAPATSVSLGAVRGDRDGSITRTLRQRLPMLRSCFAREVRANPTFTARAVLRFRVDAEGRVLNPAVTGVESAVNFAS
jgi:hypothetical protein